MSSVDLFQEWLTSHSARTEAALDVLLDSAQTNPLRLHEAMRYAAQGGGKRIRPLLVYAAGQLGDVESGSLIVGFMHGRTPTTQIIIIHTRHVIVHQ